MASTAASSIQKNFKYDVFLSFRGEDTRKTFVDHLYLALVNKGITTYKDDEKIEKGESITDQLMRSIDDSRFYIIVFSKNYASASYCLDELVKIMECQKKIERIAYLVFYDVEPTEVRNQSGVVGKAFVKHVEKVDAGRWRDALKEAANLAGWELKNSLDGHEAKLIQRIVVDISLKLSFIDSSIDENLVGMETRVKNVVSSLEIGVEDIRMIGIKGIGGGGKTTLATAVFDHISIWFEGVSFVENVREVSKSSLSGLKELQKQVLLDVSNDEKVTVKSVYDGRNKIKRMMGSRKVLLVLDDVNDINQLEALAGKPNWFKTGSRIIITIRDEQVLVAHRVSFIHDVNFLSDDEATCLFSKYAFGRETPNPGYEELSREVVHYAAGLPLTIKVLGSFLCGRIKLEWEDAIKRLKTIPLKETLEKLELSYNGLEADHKEIFLDVACIHKGEKKKKVIKILESCGFNAQIGLRVLEQKCLITVSIDDKLLLHDHIEEMGRNIVRRLHPDEPKRHNRLWVNQEIEDIFANNLGSESIRSIKLVYSDLHPATITQGLRNMNELRFLSIDIREAVWNIDKSDNYLPNSLRSLHWCRYPFECLPKSFQANKLVELQMVDSKISKLWEGEESKGLNKLRFLDLSGSKLTNINIGMMPYLEKLVLNRCHDFVELHMPVECPTLKSLNLSGSKLTAIDIRMTPYLEKLVLKGCYDFVELHMPVKCPNLKSLDLSGCKLSNFNLEMTPNLEKLVLKGCYCFAELHVPIEIPKMKHLNLSGSKLSTLDLSMTPNLEKLVLKKCADLVKLKMPIECPELKSLNLSRSKLSNFNLEMTPNLEILHLKKCENIVEIHMPVECPKLKSLNLSGSKLSKLNLDITPNLEVLCLKRCENFVELHMTVECLNLKELDLSGSKLSKLNLRMTPNIEELVLNECFCFKELHMPVKCPELINIQVSGTKYIQHMRDGRVDFAEDHMLDESLELESLDLIGSKLSSLNLGMTPNLWTLDLDGCFDFVELHMPIECGNLISLNLSGSKLSNLNLGLIPHLEILVLRNCYDFVEFHMPVECHKLRFLTMSGSKLSNFNLGLTPLLEKLVLEKCSDFVELNMPRECPKLKSLDLRGSKLSNLNLELTPHLEWLVLEGCYNFEELHMPVECLKLKSLDLRGSKLSKLNLELTPHLERLVLEGCYNFEELHMPVECLKLKSLDLSGTKICNLNLGRTPNLSSLNLKECYYLQEIHDPMRCLKNFIQSEISGCSRKLHYHVSNKVVGYVCKLVVYAKSLDICPRHPNNNFPKFEFDCYYYEPVLASRGNLEKLISFSLCACTNLESFSACICGLQQLKKLNLVGDILEVPTDLGRLESLEKLSLRLREIKHLPDSICSLKHLKSLKLITCSDLEHLPNELGRLEGLEKLDITDCLHLQDLPDSICEMGHLKRLNLSDCRRLNKLPEKLGCLKCLKELNIKSTAITDLPPSIFQLKGLCIVWSKSRLLSYGNEIKKISK